MDKSKFSELIRRYRDHELNAKVMETMNDWFEWLANDKPANPWSNTDKERLKARILEQVDEDVPDKGRISRGLWLGVAASLIFVSLFFVVGRTFFGTSVEVVSAGSTPRLIVLPDGTRVQLEAESTLEYPASFTDDARNVSLTGDAFFDVTKDRSRPFTIMCGALKTQVLGTSFSIQSDPSGDVTVAVVTGRVALSSPGGVSIELAPHEQGVFLMAENTIRKVTLDSSVWNSLLSTHYPLVFENTVFRDVLKTLEVRFDVHFVVENPDLNNCMFTADLTGESLDLALSMAGKSVGFEYTTQPHGIILRGKGC